MIRTAVLLGVFLFESAHAAPLFYGPASAAMGGTGRAGLASAQGALLNPATVPLVKDYEVNAYYRDGYIADREHRQGWAIGVVDNSEGVLFPGALHYARIRDTGRTGDPADGELWHVAGAYLFSERFSMGLSGYRAQFDVSNQPHYTQWSSSVGAIVLIHEDLSFAYVLDNIGKPGSDMPVGLRQDLEQSLGLFWRFAQLATLRADVSRREELNPKKHLTYMAGLESAVNEFTVFRFGFRREEDVDRKIWTAGFGFNGPRLRFDYAVEKNAEDTSGALHSVDMRIPF